MHSRVQTQFHLKLMPLFSRQTLNGKNTFSTLTGIVICRAGNLSMPIITKENRSVNAYNGSKM